MTSVLLVEDEPRLRAALRVSLSAAGHAVTDVGTGAEALAAIEASRPVVVVLDLGLPDVDGLEVLADLRRRSDAAVVVLTARHDRDVAVAALAAGADDYVRKPFDTAELLARIEACGRRVPGVRDELLVVGDVVIDRANRRVLRDGEPVALTRTERRLLEVLSDHPGALLGHEAILRAVWGPEYGTETHYLRTFIGQLRAKLGDDALHPRFIATEPGVGYRWVAGGSAGPIGEGLAGEVDQGG